MPGASPLYPTQIPDMTNLRTVIDDVDDVIASDHNDPCLEIIAIAQELGLLPKGSCADVTARLAVSISNDGHLLPGALITTIPTYPTSAGIPGQRAVSDTTAYFCVDTDTWRQHEIQAW